jgi:hypothetical protein
MLEEHPPRDRARRRSPRPRAKRDVGAWVTGRGRRRRCAGTRRREPRSSASRGGAPSPGPAAHRESLRRPSE